MSVGRLSMTVAREKNRQPADHQTSRSGKNKPSICLPEGISL